MRTIEEIKNSTGISIQEMAPGLICGNLDFPYLNFRGHYLAGFNEDGFEHVSVSANKKRQIPSWEVMCKVKELFWQDEENVVQIHPKASQYFHGFKQNGEVQVQVLHLWRPCDGDWSHLNEM